MDKKATGILAYITPIGWLIAFLAGDKEGAKFHLNQALVLWICDIILNIVSNLLGRIPILGGIISWVIVILELVWWILGLVHACKEEETPLPLIGGITLLK